LKFELRNPPSLAKARDTSFFKGGINAKYNSLSEGAGEVDE